MLVFGAVPSWGTVIRWGVEGRISCLFSCLAFNFFRRGFGARELVSHTSHL